MANHFQTKNNTTTTKVMIIVVIWTMNSDNCRFNQSQRHNQPHFPPSLSVVKVDCFFVIIFVISLITGNCSKLLKCVCSFKNYLGRLLLIEYVFSSRVFYTHSTSPAHPDLSNQNRGSTTYLVVQKKFIEHLNHQEPKQTNDNPPDEEEIRKALKQM
jgi:hypothetical protein